MPAERQSPIQEDYIAQNQEFWRNAERGEISKPLELRPVAKFIHARMMKTFGLEEIPTPIYGLSTWLDRPKSPSSQVVYAERYPDRIQEHDRHDFSIGISRINEYATNYAMKEFLIRNADTPILRQIVSLYGSVSNLLTYGLLLKGTFDRMGEIEAMANHEGKDFKSALLKGLFQHDFTEIDELVGMANATGYLDCNNINELAIKIGRKRLQKPDIGKWFDKLDENRNDGKLKSAVKHGVLSSTAMGVFRNHGVVEASAAIIPASPIIAVVGNFMYMEADFLANYPVEAITHPQHVEQILSYALQISPGTAATMAGLAAFLAPPVLIHEHIHYLSANEEWMGYLPAKLINKKVTPYKARLESEE